MSSIGKKIRRALSEKKPETIATLRFSEVKAYIERFRNDEKAPKDYSLVIKHYEAFMETLATVNRELEILQENGEKRFTKIANDNLKRIRNLDEFHASSFREFSVDTTQVIYSLMKIPTRIQRKTLNYTNGKETIDTLNALFQSFKHFKNALSAILEEDNAGEDQKTALNKYTEIEDSLQEKEHLQNRIGTLKKENEENKRKLVETTTNLQAAQSKIDNEVIREAKKSIASLDSEIREIGSVLKINLRKGRRPISKILHSKDRKLFAFYQHFIEFPLDNVDERFWEIVATLEREQNNLSEKERKVIEVFLSFSKHRLNAAIGEYEAAKAEKKELEQDVRRISLRNHELLRDFEHQKEIAQSELTWISQKLAEIERENNKVKTDIKKNARILEEILSKIGSNPVKVELPDDDSASYPNKTA